MSKCRENGWMKSRLLSVASSFVLAGMLLGSECLSQINTNTVGWGVEPLSISRVGSAGWQFLKLPTDARSAGMGGIKSAVSYGNANSSFNNPASAADVADRDVQFSSMKWVSDIQYNSISVVTNLGVLGVVGFNGIYLNYGDMVRTAVQDNVPVSEGLGTFGAHDAAAGLLFARQITDFLQIGGTLRYVEQQIDDAKMSSWAFDIGTLYWTGLGSLRISMLGKNFGPDGQFLSYEGRTEQPAATIKMPMMFTVGAAYDLVTMTSTNPHRVTLAAEYVKPNDGRDKVNLGFEYFAFSNLYLRGGYRINYDEESYTAGFGVEYSVDDHIKLKIDYAYANLGRFNYVNILTFGCTL